MQKARFYDRMVFAGTIYQVPFAEAVVKDAYYVFKDNTRR
jgi:hypothetical protein